MLEISSSLVKELIAEQFPQWSHLPIKSVVSSGWDNRTFHLGNDMSIRLPSAEGYALQPNKEQAWLSYLAPHLSLPISEPIAMGVPSKSYPWNWSIYRWLVGESANSLILNDNQLQFMALQLAQFLKELHQINTPIDAPEPGVHNYFRGAHPSVYDKDTRTSIQQLSSLIDAEKVLSVWEKAISSIWHENLVWIHGDFSSGNILIKEEKIVAVIDFGCMGIGDPACDLVIAWTLFKNESRDIFKSHVNLDKDTWARARGWALWKACLELNKYKDTASSEVFKQQQIINDIIHESLITPRLNFT